MAHVDRVIFVPSEKRKNKGFETLSSPFTAYALRDEGKKMVGAAGVVRVGCDGANREGAIAVRYGAGGACRRTTVVHGTHFFSSLFFFVRCLLLLLVALFFFFYSLGWGFCRR